MKVKSKNQKNSIGSSMSGNSKKNESATKSARRDSFDLDIDDDGSLTGWSDL